MGLPQKKKKTTGLTKLGLAGVAALDLLSKPQSDCSSLNIKHTVQILYITPL